METPLSARAYRAGWVIDIVRTGDRAFELRPRHIPPLIIGEYDYDTTPRSRPVLHEANPDIRKYARTLRRATHKAQRWADKLNGAREPEIVATVQ